MPIADRLYDRLTPDQRFRVAVEAFARMDLEEVDRLSDTAGWMELRVHGPAYFERLSGFYELALMHGGFMRDAVIAYLQVALLYTLRDLELAESDAASADSTAHSQSEAAATEPESPPNTDEAPRALLRAVGLIKARIKAWEDFCGEIAVDPNSTDTEKFRISFLQRARDMVVGHEDVPHDSEDYGMHIGLLRGHWGQRLQRARKCEPKGKR